MVTLKSSTLTLLLAGALLLAAPAWGDNTPTPLRIVTESWPPYVYQEDGQIKGIDWAIVQRVFQRMEVPVTLEFCPWKRCVHMVERGKADAILDISRTPEREARMLFPETAISRAPTSFFYLSGKQTPPKTLDDVAGLKAGTMAGYQYCPAIDEAGLIREDTNSLESNFRKLLLGRVDLVVANVIVGQYVLQTMGLSDDIVPTEHLQLCDGEANYLAFSRDKGLEGLADRFSETLETFKQGPEYVRLLRQHQITPDALTM